MQTQSTTNQPISLVDQIGNLLPQLTKMASFTNFVAYKVDKLDDSQKSQFERISDDLASVFFRLNELYVTMSEVERKNIGNQDKGGVDNGKN